MIQLYEYKRIQYKFHLKQCYINFWVHVEYLVKNLPFKYFVLAWKVNMDVASLNIYPLKSIEIMTKLEIAF